MNPSSSPSGTDASTSQRERWLPALDPAGAPLEGRTPAELAALARTFAAGLAYWSVDGRPDLSGLWPKFLPDLQPDRLQEAEARAGAAPQQALFLAFLRLYDEARRELNRVSERHLEFYYREVLGLKPRGPQPDHAHLVLKLKKSAAELHIPAGTLFRTKAGLAYATDFEIFANRATLAHRRLLARDHETGRLRYAAEAASQDGLGEPLLAEDPFWHPFGHGRLLPAAAIGFAVSSPVLMLREGARTITVRLTLRLGGADDTLDAAALGQSLNAYLSGESEWLDAGAPTAATAERGGNGDWEVALEFSLSGDAGPVLAYDPRVLEGGFDTLAPVMKVMLLANAPDAIAARLAAAAVSGVRLDVAAAGMKDLMLEHDFGRIDPAKAFMPFGPAPRIGSSLYINAEEALTKDVKSARLHLEWNQPPPSFAAHYTGYTDRAGRTVSSNAYFTADLDILSEGRFQPLRTNTRLFEDDATRRRTIDSSEAQQPLLTFGGVSFSSFAAQFSSPVASARVQLAFATVPVAKPLATVAAAPALALRQRFLLPARVAATRLRPDSRRGFLRLRLKQDFLHDRYPELFADAVAFNQTEPGQANPKPVPNPPYTPELMSFTLDYTARSGTSDPNLADEGAFNAREVRFFHLTPFGQREEHAWLKTQVQAGTRTVTLLPAVAHAGELYLGLAGLAARESVSLLLQFVPGSANPLATRQRVEWSVLCANHWRPLTRDEILAETTGDFLSPGVVRLLLPPETSTHNTLLQPGLVWLRAAVNADVTAVCRLLDIQPNAVAATLSQLAAATHLESSLPAGSITSAPPGLRGLKSVEQPYASFGGAAPESTRSFRIRTSERLRHRGRAVTAWDFERLVLDAFPRVFRVKALPHTDRELRTAPGCVTLVLIPDTRGQSGMNPLAPMTDLATLAAVESFLATLHTPFANAAAINPRFEPLQLRFRVKFKPGKPFASYRPLLEEQLKRHLSPWAFEESMLPDFGGGVRRSRLLAFVESLPEVDYLTDLELHPSTAQADPTAIQEVRPSTPGSIITSATAHRIDPIE